jgi:uridylate kinase
VFNMNKPGCMRAVVMGEDVGTLICNPKETK